MTDRIEKLLSSLKGISGTGNVLEKYRELKDSGHLTLDPGDYTGEGGPVVNLAAPIAYDLWYLHNHLNLVQVEAKTDDRGRAYVDGPLSFLSEKLGGIRPLRALLDLSQLTSTPVPWWSFEGASDNWENNGVYFVQKAAFEVQLAGEGLNYPSEGVLTGGFAHCAGYMAIPMGQLGVMEVISVFGEATHLEADDFELTDEGLPLFQTPPEMFPPRERAGENLCFGRHLIESGYVVPDQERTAFEPFATHFPEWIYPDVRPKGWFRLWLRKTDKFPVPGEFIGVLCKPLAVPPHVWWFQESSPFLYAGCWAETRHLTGGVITGITEEADRDDYGIGSLYTVRTQGYEIKVNASDFFGYQEGDRVGILKKEMVAATPGDFEESEDEDGVQEMAFLYTEQVVITAEDEGLLREDLMIVPIDFYKEEG
jgi:hypothetical protein